MQEQYALEKRQLKRRFWVLMVLLTLMFGIFLALGLIGNAKYADGPKHLEDMDPETLKKGAYVDIHFEKMYQSFAEHYWQQEGEESKRNKSLYYIYPYKGKGLIVQVLEYYSSPYDQLAYSSNNAELTVETTVYDIGRIEKVIPEIKEYGTEFMAEITGDPKKVLRFEDEFWPYMLNLNTVKDLGEDRTAFILKFIGSIYLGCMLLLGVVVLGRWSILKNKYSANGNGSGKLY